MEWTEFRRHGYALIDWIADYHERVEEFPVLSQVQPGEIRAQLPAHAPETGEDFATMMADVERIILPGITHWQSPNFFAFFPANTSGPSILGELLSAGLGVQGMLWATSPACTELETHVLDWLVEMLDLPRRFLSTGPGGGVIQDSASSATLCALLAARTACLQEVVNAHCTLADLRVYSTSQGHSSIEKAVNIAGLDAKALRQVEVDNQFAMRPDHLRQLLAEDAAAGHLPCMVVATLGTTSSLAFDPLSKIAGVCRDFGVWLHVDGAMAGSAAVCPEFRGFQEGLELADSYCFNPHKWLLTNFDCDCLYVARRADLIQALSVLPEYLRNQATASGAVIDYRDWQIPLGRRFRALKLWFVIRHYGVQGLQAFIRRHVDLAQEFAGWVAAHPDFELVTKPALNLVCFRHVAGDAFNEALLARLNASGALYLTHTRLAVAEQHGKPVYTLRFCVGQAATEDQHVEAAWSHIVESAHALSEEQAAGL